MATSQTTRAAIVSVLPAPAPATTSAERRRRGDHLRLLVRGTRLVECGGEGLGRQHCPVLPQGSDSSGTQTTRDVGA